VKEKKKRKKVATKTQRCEGREERKFWPRRHKGAKEEKNRKKLTTKAQRREGRKE
jgi:hypothetical protein